MFMKEYGFHGPSTQVSATCSSTNNALLVAKLWLEAGTADDVIVVSADLSLSPAIVSGFTVGRGSGGYRTVGRLPAVPGRR